MRIYSFIKPPLLSDVDILCCVTCVLLAVGTAVPECLSSAERPAVIPTQAQSSDSTERGSPLLPTAAATPRAPVPTTMLPHSPLLFAFLRQSRHVSSSPYIAAAFRHSRLPFCPPRSSSASRPLIIPSLLIARRFYSR